MRQKTPLRPTEEGHGDAGKGRHGEGGKGEGDVETRGEGDAERGDTERGRGGAGSDVVSCVEVSRSLLTGRIKPCKKQGLTRRA